MLRHFLSVPYVRLHAKTIVPARRLPPPQDKPASTMPKQWIPCGRYKLQACHAVWHSPAFGSAKILQFTDLHQINRILFQQERLRGFRPDLSCRTLLPIR